MEKTDQTEAPAPPSLIASLLGGFDAIAANIQLIVFPAVLDLLLWLGPHLKIKTLADYFAAQSSQMIGVSSADAQQLAEVSKPMWAFIGERFNLLSMLRSYPVGIPSLMVARMPIQIPGIGQALSIDVPSAAGALLSIVVFSLLGLMVGALYYRMVADAALTGHVHLGQALGQWPWSAAQVVLLALLWYGLFLAVSLPALCFISTMAFGGVPVGGLASFLYIGLLIWLIFPLLLSAHGIFVNHNNVITSVTRGVRLVRMTLPSTGLLFVMIFLISEGLDVLWKIPDEASWLTIVGVLGHAFITTGLLAASFIYYREADKWVQLMLVYWKKPTARPNG